VSIRGTVTVGAGFSGISSIRGADGSASWRGVGAAEGSFSETLGGRGRGGVQLGYAVEAARGAAEGACLVFLGIKIFMNCIRPITESLGLDDCLACSGCVSVGEPDEKKHLVGVEKIEKGGVGVVITPQVKLAVCERLGEADFRECERKILYWMEREGNVVVDSSVGSKILLEKEIKAISKEPGISDAGEVRGYPVISSMCPGVVEYVENTAHHLLPHLSRNRTPVEMCARYLKERLRGGAGGGDRGGDSGDIDDGRDRGYRRNGRDSKDIDDVKDRNVTGDRENGDAVGNRNSTDDGDAVGDNGGIGYTAYINDMNNTDNVKNGRDVAHSINREDRGDMEVISIVMCKDKRLEAEKDTLVDYCITTNDFFEHFVKKQSGDPPADYVPGKLGISHVLPGSSAGGMFEGVLKEVCERPGCRVVDRSDKENQREVSVEIEGKIRKIAQVHGLPRVVAFSSKAKSHEYISEYLFVELMVCKRGCLYGPSQGAQVSEEKYRALEGASPKMEIDIQKRTFVKKSKDKKTFLVKW